MGIRMVKCRLSLMYFYYRGLRDFNAIKKEDLPKLSKWYGLVMIIVSSITLVSFPLMFFGIIDFLWSIGILLRMPVFVFVSSLIVYRM